jgi:SSS family solute:Na+ symporter
VARRRAAPGRRGIVFFAVVTGAYTIYGGCARRRGPTSCRSSSSASAACSCRSWAARGRRILALVHEHPKSSSVFLPVSHERFPFTGVFTGFLTVGIWYTCTSQHMVQRVLAAKDEWHARMGVIGAGFLHIITPFFFVFPASSRTRSSGRLQARRRRLPHARRAPRLARPARADPRGDGGGADEQPVGRPQLRLDARHHRLLQETSARIRPMQQQVRFGQIAGALILLARRLHRVVLQPHPGVPLFVKVQNVFFFIAPPFS